MQGKSMRMRGTEMCEGSARDIRLGCNPRINFMNITIDVLTMDETVELTERYIRTGTPLHLVGVNADKVNQLRDCPELRELINACGIVNADGVSVVTASRILGCPLPERVAGIDLMDRLVALSAEKGYRVYLLGAEQSVVEEAGKRLREKYPPLILAGLRNGYFDDSDWPRVSEQLADARPELVFVGISSPKKEQLIAYLQSQGHRCVFMGVGGSFDVIAQRLKRAPVWIQKLGLEWLFRCVQEPRRLFVRYFVGNGRFILAVAREYFRKRRDDRES